jgi:hypothetical protein
MERINKDPFYFPTYKDFYEKKQEEGREKNMKYIFIKMSIYRFSGYARM